MQHEDRPHQIAYRMCVTFATVGATLSIAGPSEAQAPNVVAVHAVDYAFQAPDTVPAGLTRFLLDNRGTVRHELVIGRLKPGRTIADVMAAKTQPEQQALADGFVGAIGAGPGEQAMGSLVTDLTKGRTYILACTLRDSPEKMPHIAQGMVRVLQVR